MIHGRREGALSICFSGAGIGSPFRGRVSFRCCHQIFKAPTNQLLGSGIFGGNQLEVGIFCSSGGPTCPTVTNRNAELWLGFHGGNGGTSFTTSPPFIQEIRRGFCHPAEVKRGKLMAVEFQTRCNTLDRDICRAGRPQPRGKKN